MNVLYGASMQLHINAYEENAGNWVPRHCT